MKQLLYIFLLFTYSGYAQKIVFRGVVTDSEQIPLAYANVICKAKTAIKYAITDDEGKFQILLQKNDSIVASISYLGFEKLTYRFVADKNQNKAFELKPAAELLDGVTVEELPVTNQNDTITYNTKNFTTGSERKLKNVLKKLPGVEVTKNGGVKVQGEKVVVLLVNGKKFFGGNTKLGVDNIPADVIDKIEIIKDYNAISFLKGLSDKTKMAINIKLKKGKDHFLFGDLDVYKANDAYYKTAANTFYYAPKTTVNFIGNHNTINDNVFSLRDYMNYEGGVNAIFSKNIKQNFNDLQYFIAPEETKASKQSFAALNIIQQELKNMDLSVYGIYSSKTNQFLKVSNTSYSTFNETKNNIINTTTDFGIAKLSFKYYPSDKTVWTIDSKLNQNNNSKANDLTSQINTITKSIDENKQNKGTTFTQDIAWHKNQSEKHVFSALLNIRHNKSNNSNYWLTNNAILQNIIPLNTSQTVFRLNQNIAAKSTKINFILKDFWLINRTNNIYTTFGANHTRSFFSNKDYQKLDNGTAVSFENSGFNNTIDYRILDLYGDLTYKFLVGKFTFKQSIALHHYNWFVNQNQKTTENKTVALPALAIEWKIKASKVFRLNYDLVSDFSTIKNYSNRYLLESYNTVFKGNENVSNEVYHRLIFNYKRRNAYRGYMFYATAQYKKQVKSVSKKIAIDANTDQYYTVFMQDNPNESTTFNSRFEKRIKRLKLSLNWFTANNSYVSLQNNTAIKNKSISTNYDFAIRTLYTKFPELRIGFKHQFATYYYGSHNSKTRTITPYLTLDYDYKNFIFNCEYSYTNYLNKNNTNKEQFHTLEASLFYQGENSAWSFELFGKNILGTSYKESNTLSAFMIASERTAVFPRVIGIGISYKL